MTQSPSIFKDNKPTHAKMASYSWVLEMTKENRRRRRSSSSSCSNRNTSRRCTFKYFTKTGIFLGLVIILMALPSHCRPVENSDYVVYAPHHQHHQHDDEVGASGEGARFEFSRKIDTTVAAGATAPSSSHNNSSLELISDDINDPLLNNSSMIVHVIVTSSSSSSSSSSTSSSEIETDSDLQEVSQDNLQYTIDDEGEGEQGEGEEERGSLVEEKKSPPDSSTPFPSDSESFHRDLELQKLPKSQEKPESEPQPVQDIFSAFYRAFSQPSSSSASTSTSTTSLNIEEASFPTEETITTFMIRPRGTKRQRQNLNLSPERRREFLYRQQERRKLEAVEKNGSGSIIMMMMGDEDHSQAEAQEKSGPVDVSIVAEAAAQRLELLAKKIDKSDQKAETSFSSSSAAAAAPPKIAVSVAITHSKSVAQGASSSSSSNSKSDEQPKGENEQVGYSKNAKSESTFLIESSQEIHDSSSSPSRPRPLIKSLPRNDDDAQAHARYKVKEEEKAMNKNHNNYTRHNFPTNFGSRRGSTSTSSGASTKDLDGDGQEDLVEESEIDFRIIKDRNNIIPLRRIAMKEDPSRRYSLPQDFQASSSYPRAEPSSFIEITTYRPSFRPGGGTHQRRKIARTVSEQIGDGSLGNSPFNFKLNYIPSSSSTTQQPSTTTTKASSTFRNWQQPEKVWSEPARVWGVPAKVWGEPARIWSEPAKVWGEPEKIWGETQRQHEKQKQIHEEEELMQGDQPPPPQEEEETNGNFHHHQQREAHEEDNSSSSSPRGTFVILGDDENEGDSIDGDLGRPLMLHHFTIPPTDKGKETVITSSSISTSVSTSSRVSSTPISNKNNSSNNNSANNRNINGSSGSFSRKVAYFQQQQSPSPGLQYGSTPPVSSPQSNRVNNDDALRPREQTFRASDNNSNNNNNTNNEETSGSSQKKSGKKFGYVIEGSNVRKYRVEERTPDGFIVGEYGVLNNQNAFLRGVRYTADGTINPRLIHEALMKFLSLRRRRRR
ncbi:unnamed protein product [Orchesella dallaii]|uniref:Uncharacterized protein n=1 Tax=Orchesella dallaii TaxID=48710 RepID=A0ABP1R173_9HEXA